MAVNLSYCNQENYLPQLKQKKTFLDPNSLKNFISNPIIKTLSRILEATLLTEERLNTAKRL